MKKVLAVLGLMLGLVGLSHAGTPKDQNPNSWSNFMHGNAVIGSSMTTAGINQFAAPAPGTSQGQNCQTCLTKIILQLSAASTAYILEGGTTDYIILGQGLASSGVNTLSLPEDHLGPLCFQTGNTAIFNILPITGSNPASVNFEGFVDCGGSRN